MESKLVKMEDNVTYAMAETEEVTMALQTETADLKVAMQKEIDTVTEELKDAMMQRDDLTVQYENMDKEVKRVSKEFESAKKSIEGLNSDLNSI